MSGARARARAPLTHSSFFLREGTDSRSENNEHVHGDARLNPMGMGFWVYGANVSIVALHDELLENLVNLGNLEIWVTCVIWGFCVILCNLGDLEN